MSQQNNDSLEKRPEIAEISNGIIEMAESEFNAPTAAEKLTKVITQLDFGEVILKIVKGKIQTMSITKHYKIDKVDVASNLTDLTNNGL